MSSKYIRAYNAFKNVITGGGKKSKTISSVPANIGNLKKNKETFDRLIKTTDKYVVGTADDKKLSKELRKIGSKSLQKTDKILRKNKKDGGRMGLKKGSFPDHSGDGKITKKDILMAKGVIPKTKNKKSKKKFI